MGDESTKPASAPTGAVFLSYASQDAEAAQRICDALRAAAITVGRFTLSGHRRPRRTETCLYPTVRLIQGWAGGDQAWSRSDQLHSL